MRRVLLLIAAGLLAGLASAEQAELPGIRHWEAGHNLETVYESIYKQLEDNRLFVVFEPNIGANLANFAARWGEDYNRSELTAIRSMVFCNAWYANQVSNIDPRLLALCPLHISLYEQSGRTHVVFVRPTYVGTDSAALDLLTELEGEVAQAIEQGIEAVAGETE